MMPHILRQAQYEGLVAGALLFLVLSLSKDEAAYA